MADVVGTAKGSRSLGVRVGAVMAVAALASFVAVVGAFGSSGGSTPGAQAVAGNDGAGAFVRTVVRLIAANRYDDAWPLLHPTHRATVGRAAYVACERLSPIPGRLVAVRAGEAFEERTAVAPGRLADSRAVPIVIVLLDLATSEQVVVHDTVHAVRAEGRWRWILPPERLGEYGAGRCPGAPPAVR